MNTQVPQSFAPPQVQNPMWRPLSIHNPMIQDEEQQRIQRIQRMQNMQRTQGAQGTIPPPVNLAGTIPPPSDPWGKNNTCLGLKILCGSFALLVVILIIVLIVHMAKKSNNVSGASGASGYHAIGAPHSAHSAHSVPSAQSAQSSVLPLSLSGGFENESLMSTDV